MSLALAALLASTALPPTLPACSWNRPGHDPFMGDVVAAVDRYADIPAPVRARLKARMARRSYDEIVSIRRDAIVGQARYRPEIRDMHFGAGQVCGTVDRLQWQSTAQERGLVYCESGHCILVPTVCRNVSRITREEPAAPPATTAAASGQGGPGGDGHGSNADAGTGTRLEESPGPSAGALPPALAALGAMPSAGAAEAPVSFVDGLAPAGAGAGGAAGRGAPFGGPVDHGPAAVRDGWTPGRPGATAGFADADADGPSFDAALGVPRKTLGLPNAGGLAFEPAPPLPAPALPVPEPGRWLLMLGGLAVLAWRSGAARAPARALLSPA